MKEQTQHCEAPPLKKKVAIVGAGISGLGAAWALSKQPEQFDFRVFEAQDQIGGNAITADMPKDDSTSIPFDISVTACIPSVYHHILIFMEQHGIKLLDTKFSYSVRYHGEVYAHDFDSEISRHLEPEIGKISETPKTLASVRLLVSNPSLL